MITVFDGRSRRHSPPGYIVAGRLQPSPERPERIDLLLEGVRAVGASLIEPPAIALADVGTVHSRRYLDFLSTVLERWRRIEGAADWPVPNIHALGRPGLAPAGYPDGIVGQCGFHIGDGSAPILDDTVDAALGSAASALHGADLVAGGERLVYALCRPPGHHAASETAAGFCYLNNTALAAEHLTRRGIRTAILDIDVHHGNGTEAIFWERADVLTVSIHADPARFYPYFWGYADAVGAGPGAGFNLNMPLPRGTDDGAFLEALAAAIERIARHRADVLVLATGLDASAEDPFQGFAVTTAGFERIGAALRRTGLPVLAVQEGGYPSPILGRNLAALLAGLGA
jgi:acetoin utilization deacetylase AcuC-like enzyme